MKKWYETSASEKLTDEQRSEMWRDLRKELLQGWLIIFGVQMLLGAYHLHSMWAEFADVPAWGIGVIWVLGSAIMATILLPIAVIVLFLAGAIVFGILLWKDSRSEG